MTAPSTPRSRANRRRRRKVRTRSLVFVAVAACFLLLVGRGAAQIAGQVSCSSNDIVLTVAVSPDVAPAIQRIADYFNGQQHRADGHCVTVAVNPEPPALAAAQIDGQKSAPRPPIDAWIPDSSLWVDMARRLPLGAKIVQPAGYSVALSPLMLVMPRAAAARAPSFGKTGWRFLLPRSAGGPAAPATFRVELPDPSQSAAGLATLIEVARLLGQGQAARVRFTRFVYNSQVSSSTGESGSLRLFAGLAAPPLDSTPVTVASEQAVLAYDRRNPRDPLAASYPAGASSALGSPELDYPYVLTSPSTRRLDAASLFGKVLTQPYAQGVIRYLGFRSGHNVPDRIPAAFGLSKQLLQVASPASATEGPAVLQVYDRLALRSRDLAVVDVSAAMARPASPADPGGPTLEQELTQTASLGLALFPDSANVGLWTFADRMRARLPYRQLVSVGPLPASAGVISRRAELERINTALKPDGGGRVALYGTILDAYRYMQRTYQPSYFNTVVVLASGHENAPGDISAKDLIRQLARLSNSPRKVAVIIIAFSASADFGTLRKIASTTGGQAYQITDPSQVGRVFYQALAHRLCDHGCVAP